MYQPTDEDWEAFPTDAEMDEFTHEQRQKLIFDYIDEKCYYYNEMKKAEEHLQYLFWKYDTIGEYLEDFLEREAEYEKNTQKRVLMNPFKNDRRK